MICFACEKEYDDTLRECPHCGFNQECAEEIYCPYSIDGVCVLTETSCWKDTDFELCSISKQARGEIENEEGN